MLHCFTLTPCSRPATEVLHARITAAARRLDIADPLPDLGELFQRTFARPIDDPAYSTNRLQPGALPLEWSFAEGDPDALRIELQPFDPSLAPEERRRLAIAEWLSLVGTYHGETLAAQFAAAVKEDTIKRSCKPTWGAFLGLVVRSRRTPEFKIYIELDPADESKRSDVVSSIVGVIPHFRSVKVGEGAVAERIYYLCRDGLSLLDLEAICAVLGRSHRFPALLVMMLELTDGEFYLPPRSVLLGIRRAASDTELKVELISGLAMNPEGLTARIERLPAPAAIAPYRRWSEIVHPTAPRDPVPRVVSVRISASQPIRLSVYAAEPGSEP